MIACLRDCDDIRRQVAELCGDAGKAGLIVARIPEHNPQVALRRKRRDKLEARQQPRRDSYASEPSMCRRPTSLLVPERKPGEPQQHGANDWPRRRVEDDRETIES